MTKRMLIDAADPAEVRVVVLNRSRVEEFDHEIRSKAQLKGNIYLAKVTRVEPSLQAAFVDYGGNRHGFLPFSEIHPDYYRIPIADREALLAEEAALRVAVDEEDEEDEGEAEGEGFEETPATVEAAGRAAVGEDAEEDEEPGEEDAPLAAAEEESAEENGSDEESSEEERVFEAAPDEAVSVEVASDGEAGQDEPAPADSEASEPEGEDEDEVRSGRAQPHVAEEGDKLSATPEEAESEPPAPVPDEAPALHDDLPPPYEPEVAAEAAPADEPAAGSDPVEEAVASEEPAEDEGTPELAATETNGNGTEEGEEEPVDTVGGDDVEDAARKRAKLLRRYKIQEVIKRGQVMLVQVSKEERGNKGAALTTYLSLPGRYCVLMPNTARGGGISRKIGSAADRRRLKTVLGDLSIPEGMAVIVRTAGSERSKAEIKRDYEYLLRLWSEIREITLNSQAPALIYEEGNLIKRAIRDLYSSDTEEILVEGEEAYKAAKAFMRSLMPSHAKKVQLYKDPAASLFLKYGVESQLGGMFDPTVQLKSGGYIVINVTEALVAIDVNSGKATRERHIEETALKTNQEAAEEVARQLRLRDLAGLIVIDFIDMEEPRHNREVERRLKEAMKSDRARIQLGRISPFGLLELSRQRLRPSLVETATVICPHCQGTGRVYSAETAALHLLRGLSEEGMRRPGGELQVTVATRVALYLLNHKREQLQDIEQRYGFVLRLEVDERLHGLEHRVERPGQGRGERDRGERDRGERRSRREERGREEEREEGREEPRESGRRERGHREERRSDDRRSEDRRSKRSEEKRAEEKQPEETRGEEKRPEEKRGEEKRGDRRRGDRRRGRSAAAVTPAAEEAAPEALEETPLPLAEGEEAAVSGEQTAAPAVPGAEEDDERPRRRRRRGKRGGRRRGRRAEDGQELENGEAAGDDEEDEHDEEEGEEPQAVVESDEAPAPEELPEEAPPVRVIPADDPPLAAAPEVAEAEEAPTASAFDVITEVDPQQPKRRGWWNRLVK